MCPGPFPSQEARDKIDDHVTGHPAVRLRTGATSAQLLSIVHKLEKRWKKGPKEVLGNKEREPKTSRLSWLHPMPPTSRDWVYTLNANPVLPSQPEAKCSLGKKFLQSRQAMKFEWRSESGVGRERDELLHTHMDSFLGANHLHFQLFCPVD